MKFYALGQHFYQFPLEYFDTTKIRKYAEFLDQHQVEEREQCVGIFEHGPAFYPPQFMKLKLSGPSKKTSIVGNFIFGLHSIAVDSATLQLFENAGLKGYETRPCEVGGIEDNLTANGRQFHYLFVTGRAVVHPKCGVREIYRCRICDTRRYGCWSKETGLIVDESRWDGSDFFQLDGYDSGPLTGPRFVSNRVRELIEAHGLTPVSLCPIEEFECDSLREEGYLDPNEVWKYRVESEERQ